MASDPLAFALVAFLLTYLIHSTLLLAGAWLLEAVFEFESVRLRERLWRVALLGGFVTAGLQLGLGLETPMARWVLRAEPAVAAVSDPSLSRLSAAPPRADPVFAVRAETTQQHARTGLRAQTGPRSSSPRRRAEPAPAPAAGPGTLTGSPVAALATWPGTLDARTWTPWLARGFGALACGALALLALSAARLRARLRGAVELTAGPEVEALAELARRARLARPVRLLVAPALRSPLTSGLWRPLICVPPRALAELAREEREAMLAHELGHVARRDPAWLTLDWLIARACFFQPLNILARRRLAVAAELLADDWAVRHTGRYLPLASCLARIAGWITERPRLLTAHMTVAREARGNGSRARSQLGRRIERLLEERRRSDEPSRRWWSPAALGLLGSLALVAPGVAARAPGKEPAPARPATEPAAVPAAPRAAPAAQLEAEPTPAPGSAASAAGTLDGELLALDEEVALLERELGLLRGDLAAFASDPAVAETLRGIEAHARALSARRDRMQLLIRMPADPNAFRVRP